MKADISSDETCRRRRAYTEIDDLLADDIKQGEKAASDVEGAIHRNNTFSSRNSSNRPKRHQLSDLGGDSNKGRVSINLGGIVDALGADGTRKRENKA